MKKTKSFLAVFAIFFSSTGHGAGATEVAPKANPAPPAKSSITDSADKTKSSNSKGEIMNMAMGVVEMGIGAAFVSTCPEGPSCPMAPLMFLMGVQSFMQGAAQGKTAGQAANTVGMTDTGLGLNGYDPEAVKKLAKDPDMKIAKEFMATVAKGGAGFTYDPKTVSVTTADGKTIKGSDLNSPAAMEAAGIPKSAIDAISGMEKSIMAKVEKKVGKLNMDVLAGEESSSGGGGGSGSGSGSASSAASGGEAYGARTGSAAGLGLDRDPAQLAGMQKNYNGEPIGVAGDSIFKMMTRRYKTKEAQDSFIDESDILIQK